jgi:poly(3-hydroxybutyrate) depolymerase
MMRWAAAVFALLWWSCCSAAPARAAERAGVTAADRTAETSRALVEAMQRLEAAKLRVYDELGAEVAVSFQRRLFDDLEAQHTAPPEGYAAADWAETVATVARLDIEAADQLAGGTPAPLRAAPGLHEVLIPSRADRTLQLVAVYVPPNAPAHRAPLAVVLHGNPQTEAELLGQPFLRRLADRTGTILVAPFGRGLYDYAEPAATDVYDLLADVQRAFDADRGRTYLAGYSMGGFSVFMIGPRGGYRWSGVLCISGAILNSGVRAVSIAWHEMRLYVVTGANDTSIPTRYGEQTASYLAGIGLPVSFYEEPHGTHALRTLTSSLQRAWDDMHASLTRPETVPAARSGFGLPAGTPGAVTKPY